MAAWEWLYLVPFVVVFYILIVIFTPLDFEWTWFILAWIIDIVDYIM